MALQNSFFLRWASRTAIFLVLFVALDLAIFFLLPVKLLYQIQFEPLRLPVDVAAILFHDFNEPKTGISNETKRRIHYGLSLLQNNKAKALIVAGGSRPDPEINGAALMADYLRKKGIPDDTIIVEDSSRDTLSNLENIQEIMRQRDFRSAGLVSSPYHLLRLKALNIGAHENFQYDPYDIFLCFPPLTRKEIWFSAHYNLTAFAAATVLSEERYRNIVSWIRENTEY